jgi:hypothetical protein
MLCQREALQSGEARCRLVNPAMIWLDQARVGHRLENRRCCRINPGDGHPATDALAPIFPYNASKARFLPGQPFNPSNPTGSRSIHQAVMMAGWEYRANGKVYWASQQEPYHPTRGIQRFAHHPPAVGAGYASANLRFARR